MIKVRGDYLIWICLLIVGIASCGGDKESSSKETFTEGSTTMLVDESIFPIIEDELAVFQSTYTKADIKLLSRPENILLKDFVTGDIRVALMTRQLTPQEAKFYENQKIKIRVNRFAIDALAIIANKADQDTVVKIDELIQILKGEGTKGKTLVFDNPNSSTVRYLKELSGITQLPQNGVYAMNSNPEVIKYVSQNKGAFGVVGINWIEQPDKTSEELLENVKILGVSSKGGNKYFWPTQNDLAIGAYPLTRDLYIINCQGTIGLGTGFATFLAGERGQRIVLKSGLLPDSIPSREIIIRKNIN